MGGRPSRRRASSERREGVGGLRGLAAGGGGGGGSGVGVEVAGGPKREPTC